MMGTDEPGIPQDGEGPQRKVWLDPFYIEEHEVTNQQFQHFTNQTGYITEVTHTHTLTYRVLIQINTITNNQLQESVVCVCRQSILETPLFLRDC